MLTKHHSRVCTFFAADFDPRFGPEVSSAASRIYEEHRPPKYRATMPSLFQFAWPETRNLLVVTHSRVAWQTLGLRAWNDSLQEHLSVVTMGLQTMHVSAFKRIGFKIVAYLPLSMSHAEMCKLMFGAFVLPEEDFQQVSKGGRDPLLHMEGESGGLEYLLIVTSLSKAQASKHFFSFPNLDLFLAEMYLDVGLKDFHDRVTESDCFLVDIDLFRTNVGIDCLEGFVKEALGTAEAVTDACVRRLLSKPQEPREKSWGGNH